MEKRNIAKVAYVGVGLIDDNRERNDDRAIAFEQDLHVGELFPGAEFVVDQNDLFTGKRLDKLAESPGAIGTRLVRAGASIAFGPVDPLRLQRLADAVSDRQSTGSGSDDGKFGNDRPDFGVGAQQTAQPHAERLRVLVIAHREGDLQEFVRVQAIGVHKMTLAQSPGVAEYTDDLIVSGQQVHRRRTEAPFKG